ncbi:MAG: hypothetical protein C4315_07550 [Chloroflexota bacterium]
MKTRARPAAEDQNRPLPGQLLRAARQERGLTLEDAEQGTRIRREFLEALEADAYERLPAPVYVRGFIRVYARWLGLDPEQVVGLYPIRPTTPEFRPLPTVRNPESAWPGRLLVGLVVVALVVLGYGVVRLAGSAGPAPAPTVGGLPGPTSAPAPTRPPPPPTPTPAVDQVQVQLRVVERAWVAVTVDNQQVFQGILEVGDTRTWTGRQRVAIRCGNAGGVEVYLNGRRLGLLGRPGQVVDVEWTLQDVRNLQ